MSAGDVIENFKPEVDAESDQMVRMRIAYGRDLIQEGRRIVAYIASARVPMPMSTERFFKQCNRYSKAPLP